MTFGDQANKIAAMNGKMRPGIQALLAPDRARLDVSWVRLKQSLALDDALTADLPHSPRWDYAIVIIATQSKEEIHWIEVHPASGHSSIREVAAKYEWLRSWIKLNQLDIRPRQFLWIASGRSSFNNDDPKIKALAKQGLLFVGRRAVLKKLS